MSKRLLQLQAALALFCFFLMSGCGGTSPKTSSTSQAPIQFVSPASSPSIDAGQSITVTVSIASGTAASWSLQGGNGFAKPVGMLTNLTGTSATYNAPMTIFGQTQDTIVATAGGNSASMGVLVEPLPFVVQNSQTLSSCPPSGTVVSPGSQGTMVFGQTQNFGIFGASSFSSGVTGGVAPYSWTVETGSLPTGLTLSVGTNTTQPFLVGAPIASGCSTFTLQVTDAAGMMATSSNLDLVVLPPTLKVTVPIVGSALISSSNAGIPYPPIAFLASGGVPPYTWSAPTQTTTAFSNALPVGLSMSSNGLLLGTPSPFNLASNGDVPEFTFVPSPVTVSDSQLPYPATGQINANGATNFVLDVADIDSSCQSGNESYLTSNAPYAFSLRGFDANGPVTISGNFTVDGKGNITSGVEDIIRISGTQTNLPIATGSTYTFGNLNRGCVTIMTGSAGSTSTTTFRIAMGGCSAGQTTDGSACQAPQTGSFYLTTGHMEEFDDNTGSGTRVSGIVRLQDSSAFQNSSIAGMYAFGLTGWDFAGGRFAMAGSASASSGSWSSVAADTNDAGTLGSALTGGSGSFTIGSNGRGTGTLTVGSLSLSLIVYPVSSQDLLLTTLGPSSTSNPQLSGEAVATTGPFSPQSMQNSHMFHIAGVSSAGPDPSIGILAFDGAGNVTGTEFENQAGTLSTTSLTGTYNLDGSSGRISFIPVQNQNQSLGAHPLIGYAIPAPSTLTSAACATTPAACVTGFLVSTDATAQGGILEFQTNTTPAPPFVNSSLLGFNIFGSDEPLDTKTANFVGYTKTNPNTGTLSPSEDASYGDPQYCLVPGCVLLIPNWSISNTDSYSVSANGSGTFGSQTASVTNGSTTFYIDEFPLDTHPSVMVAEQ